MPLRRAKAEEQKQRRVTLNAKEKHYFWEGFEGDVDNANKGESG